MKKSSKSLTLSTSTSLKSSTSAGAVAAASSGVAIPHGTTSEPGLFGGLVPVEHFNNSSFSVNLRKRKTVENYKQINKNFNVWVNVYKNFPKQN